MDHMNKLRGQIRWYLLGVIVSVAALGVSTYGLVSTLGVESIASMAIALAVSLLIAYVAAELASRYVMNPLKILEQAVLHVTPKHDGTPAPNLEQVKLGRELLTSLVLQVYQLASSTDVGQHSNSSGEDLRAKSIASNLPLPLLVMDKMGSIIFANEASQKYLMKTASELQDKNVYDVLDLSFQTEQTLDTWLNDVRATKVVATQTWEQVRLKLPDSKNSLQFDMAAYYNKDNPSRVETMLVLFDHTDSYNQRDQGLSFIAIAVHELRTPITLLRGYIEVFGDELKDKLNPELHDFMEKMQASAQQLSAFVNNILNVARVEANQLVLELSEQNWPEIVKAVGHDLDLRAHIKGKTIEYYIADNLPTVGADRVSAYEVLANLLDNAIKYSNKSQKIEVRSYLTKDGVIETTVTDQGMGIPESVIPHLFERFYRNHRTQAQVGGTGLGLYLSKAIVEAHGGHIWVRSKEGQGTVVGFTLQPYALVAGKLKGDSAGIVRQAHGWIKNHSLYRR
ncbi:hypothetical protein A3D14_03760 [Candidatus Saccharibacteria bacterium RIFCSPHIGHO2_02_FULL_47_12]|nr:MAG: hypothetical protein A3D14_03760 [Candidatus Saccharibacteria bacterium RIFCSPHIGHO2_02_FULL_47_12]